MNYRSTANKTPLPVPTTFSISVLCSSGADSKEFPTFSLSYLGSEMEPEDNLLGDIHAYCLNFEPFSGESESLLEIVGFLQPRKELLDFSHSVFIKIPVPVAETKSIFRKVSELGRYIILVSTESYCYRGLVDDESGEVLESSIDYRYII